MVFAIEPEAERAARLTRLAIGAGLQRAFDRVLDEPMPRQWLELLRQRDDSHD